MLHRGWAITLGVALHLVACGPSGESPQAGSTEYGPWVGSEESDGSVVTVVNESGSVWQRSASLLEESHIGAEAADPEYMLGRVTGLWATDDETYVVDASIPAVRVYDAAGLHLRDIGRQGQGPGEYQRPLRVAVAVDGRVFVVDLAQSNTITVYSPDDGYVGNWAWPERARPARPRLTVGPEAVPYLEVIKRAADGIEVFGMQPLGPGGAAGEFRAFPRLEFDSPNLTYLGGGLLTTVPFMPSTTWAMTSDGKVASGVGSEYRFTLEGSDGSRMVVERFWEPVAIGSDERAAHTRFIESQIRSEDPGWTWNGPDVPEHKPAFSDFFPDRTGGLLVRRQGSSRRVDSEDCTDDPTPDDFRRAREANRSLRVCWESTWIWDVFDDRGRFLGSLDVPEHRVVADPHWSGRILLLAVENDLGTVMVKRYRLVLLG